MFRDPRFACKCQVWKDQGYAGSHPPHMVSSKYEEGSFFKQISQSCKDGIKVKNVKAHIIKCNFGDEECGTIYCKLYIIKVKYPIEEIPKRIRKK